VSQRAEDLYVARSVASDTSLEQPPVSFVDVLRYLSDPSAHLTPAQWRFCQQHPRLRADYEGLLKKLAIGALPQAAAASQGELQERSFSGGLLRIRPSSIPGQVYLIFSIDPAPHAPRLLVIEGTDGSVARIALPEPDSDGSMLVIQDTDRSEADANAVRLLRDPTTSGIFLP
jgi:hypothetical protein